MSSKTKKIQAVDVYLEKRKSREYVGQLTRSEGEFIFTYADSYLYQTRSISLGPDLPLTQKKFISETLFPSFEDRIPSHKNPAYPEYCKMVGISPATKDVLTLVATLGHKGASSFVFCPVIEDGITSDDIINFRKNLKLTVREFSELFDFATTTISKIETQKKIGKEVKKRLEIYYHFPEVALYEVMKNRFKIKDEKINHVEKFFRGKLTKE